MSPSFVSPARSATGLQSHLAGGESARQVAVVDPLGKFGAPESVLEARDLGASIALVIETYTISGHC